MKEKLNFDYTIERKSPANISAKSLKAVRKPLTKEERATLLQTCWPDCARIYANRFDQLTNNFECEQDLRQEAWYHYNACLDYFCKERWQKPTQPLEEAFRCIFSRWCRFYKRKSLSQDRCRKRSGSRGTAWLPDDDLVYTDGVAALDYHRFLRILRLQPQEVQDALYALFEEERSPANVAAAWTTRMKTGRPSQFPDPFSLLEAASNAIEQIISTTGFSARSFRTRGQEVVLAINDYMTDPNYAYKKETA